MMVMTMTAIDYDDLEEGTNAKLKYSIEKNVIDENTGTPIFEIEEDTGVIKTAVCCLDREKTPDYSIQVKGLVIKAQFFSFQVSVSWSQIRR
jgi:Cadherin domain